MKTPFRWMWVVALRCEECKKLFSPEETMGGSGHCPLPGCGGVLSKERVRLKNLKEEAPPTPPKALLKYQKSKKERAEIKT